MNRKLLIILTHILGCLFFLALPYLLAQNGMAHVMQLATDQHEQRNLLSYGLAIAFFYLNYFVLIPRFFFFRRYWLYGLWVLGSFVVMSQTLSVVNRGLFVTPIGQLNTPPRPGNQGDTRFPSDGRPPNPPPPGLPPEGSQTFFLFLAGGLLSLAIRVNNRWRETEQRQLSAELSYLKAQINPHFLFNTLNSIYDLAITKADQTPEAIVRLAGLMRYTMQQAALPDVPLAHELEYIDNYIALQRFRLGETLDITYTVTGSSTGLTIVPMLLISFVENAFKHGVNPSQAGHIRIEMTISDGELHCHAANEKVRQPSVADSSGIGLSNTRTRLDLLYPGRYQLRIADEQTTYTTDLYLTLT